MSIYRTLLVSIFLAATASIYLGYRGVIDFSLGFALAAGTGCSIIDYLKRQWHNVANRRRYDL